MSNDETSTKVLQLFLAGATYRQIANAVSVPQEKVHEIVLAELSATGDRRAILTSEASAVVQERTEALFRAHWGPALGGDHRSAEICRRILDRQGRQLFGEETTVETGDSIDEIAARRAARRASRVKRSS